MHWVITSVLSGAADDARKKGASAPTVKRIDIRDSDSFPQNRNFDEIADSKGNVMTFCYVGKENQKFLEDLSKKFNHGSPVNIDHVKGDIRTQMLLKKQNIIYWEANNGAHFYFGHISAVDVARLQKLGKKNVQARILEERIGILKGKIKNRFPESLIIILSPECNEVKL